MVTNRMSEQTKKQLTAAFFTVLEDKSYDAVAITDITAAAGVSRRSFYRAYANKAALLDSYLDSVISDWIVYARAHRTASYHVLVEVIFTFWQRQTVTLTLLVRAGLSSYIFEQFNMAFPRFFLEDDGTPAYAVTWEANAQQHNLYMFRLSIGALWNVFSNWLLHQEDMSLAELTTFVQAGFRQLGS